MENLWFQVSQCLRVFIVKSQKNIAVQKFDYSEKAALASCSLFQQRLQYSQLSI